jgi:hypothetical protein
MFTCLQILIIMFCTSVLLTISAEENGSSFMDSQASTIVLNWCGMNSLLT